ncbi:MAG TPA: hypothetical protein VGR37_06850 [Longimicrobiaceae bacterium]|nr:hypothetical protein [Longimicrobiaceae bacterium]
MRAFFAVYTRTFSLRFVSEKKLERRVAHTTIDKFLHGSVPVYATMQLLRKLYMDEYRKDLPTDPDPQVAAIYLTYLLNRIPDEHRRAAYDEMVRALRHVHIRAAADVPPWLERTAELYESDEPPPPPAPPPIPPPRPRGPDDEPPQYPRGRGRKKS